MNSQAGPFGQGPALGQRMPPYSTDPELSRQRHAEPDYTNSSDTGLYTSTTDETMVDAFIPSSPPPDKREDETEDDDEDDDDATDEDEDEPLTQTRIVAARSESTLRLGGSSKLAVKRESSLRASPEMLIASLFDNDRATDITLEDRGLTKIPAAFQDLADHEDLGSRKFKINLTNNQIRKVNKDLYSIGRLQVLLLRSNNILGLSPLIRQLTNLEELQLSNNDLRTLPAELLTLPKLQTLTTFPNPFVAPPDESTRSMLIIKTPVPSLIELAQRKIAQAAAYQPYADFERTIQQLVQQFPNLNKYLDPVLDCVYMGKICSVCGTPYIKPAAMHLQWELFKGQHIPFRTTFCSHACIAKFHN